MNGRAHRLLRALVRRLDDGAFGVCRSCGAPIEDDRLEQRPKPEFCRVHTERVGRVLPAGC